MAVCPTAHLPIGRRIPHLALKMPARAAAAKLCRDCSRSLPCSASLLLLLTAPHCRCTPSVRPVLLWTCSNSHPAPNGLRPGSGVNSTQTTGAWKPVAGWLHTARFSTSSALVLCTLAGAAELCWDRKQWCCPALLARQALLTCPPPRRGAACPPPAAPAGRAASCIGADHPRCARSALLPRSPCVIGGRGEEG